MRPPPSVWTPPADSRHHLPRLVRLVAWLHACVLTVALASGSAMPAPSPEVHHAART